MTTDPKQGSPDLLPVWLSVTIIAICLAGGGWMIHWYLTTDPLSHESTVFTSPSIPVQESNTGPGPGGPPRQVRNTHGVTDNQNGTWTVRSKQANADFLVADGSATLRFAVFNDYSFASKDARTTLTGLRTILNDNRRIELLQLTPQQIGQLRGLNRRVAVDLSQQDKDRLCGELLAYVEAAEQGRPPLEAKLEQSLDAIAQQSGASAKQQAEQRAAQINAIITPEQWERNRSIVNGK